MLFFFLFFFRVALCTNHLHLCYCIVINKTVFMHAMVHVYSASIGVLMTHLVASENH
jgi:hypothetical protein